MNARLILSILLPSLAATMASAADWTRFRGPNGSGLAPDDKPLPTEWSDDKNLVWKTPLPGPGASSPIISGGRVFVTCWSGYATEQSRNGTAADLKRHLVCVDRATGKVLWDQAIAAKLPEDRSQHGYASHTPVTDGKNVYVFFGKSGVFAFDFSGKELWRADVGSGLDRRSWGSACSPILYENLLIVTASPESGSMYAFDTATGKTVWKSQADGYGGTWGTPIVAEAGGVTDIVLSVPNEIWGINPANGKLRWFSEGLRTDSACNSAITDAGMIYAVGDRGAGSLAVKAGGKGDVSATNIAWTGSNGARIPTPILWEGRLFWVNGSIANCRDAKTGKDIYAERLPSTASSSRERSSGFGDRGGGRMGGMGAQDYASPVGGGGYLYQVTRRGETMVIRLGAKFELVARNGFTSDTSDYSATPAISDGQLFIRSARNLYCIGLPAREAGNAK